MPDATGALRAAALLRFGMQRLANVGNRNGVVWASSKCRGNRTRCALSQSSKSTPVIKQGLPVPVGQVGNSYSSL